MRSALPIGVVVRVRPHPVIFPRGGLGALGLGVVQVLAPAQTATIASTIQQVEGYYPGSVAYRNNNPGNLKYVGQAGATGADANGFAVFPDYATGLQALDDQIQLYAGRGLSIQGMMQIYAPASDGNNPNSYAAQVAGALGVDPSTSLLALSLPVGSAPLPSLPDLSSGFDLSSITGSLDAYSATALTTAGLVLLGFAFLWPDE
jgi:hypothetical protein